MSLFIPTVLTIIDILVIYIIVAYFRRKSLEYKFLATSIGYMVCIITVLFIWLYIEPCLYMEEVKKVLYG